MIWRLQAYKKTIFRVGSIILSYFSIVGFFFTLELRYSDFGILGNILIPISLALFVTAIILELGDIKARRVMRPQSKEVRDYMFRWIDKGRRVVIFSRDLSWVNDDEMKDLFLSKAKRNELSVCLPNERDLTSDLKDLIQDLKRNNANVYTYSHIEHVPESRFTIINFDTAGARVAVGYPRENFHVIEEFSANEHPAFYMAKDLVSLVKKCSSVKETEKGVSE